MAETLAQGFAFDEAGEDDAGIACLLFEAFGVLVGVVAVAGQHEVVLLVEAG